MTLSTWVLIIVLNQGLSGIAVTTQEFDSEASCRAALTMVKEGVKSNLVGSSVGCIAK